MFHFLIPRFIPHTTLQCPYVFSRLFNFRSFSVFSNHPSDNLTLSNLINSCDLSPETSLKLSTRLKLVNPDGPNAVIQLFRSYGFSDSQLSKLVKKRPFLLLSDAENTLLPKLEFLRSIGVSNIDFPKILTGNTSFLVANLEKNLIPRYEIVRSLVRDNKEVVSALKHGSWIFYNHSMVNDSVPNVEVLRKLGVPQRFVSLLVSYFPSVAFNKHSVFVEAVNSVIEMGFNPLKLNFVLALRVIVSMDKENWESKFKIYERWGWSRDICLLAFQKRPQCMLMSEKSINKTMKFLVKDAGLSPEVIAKSPAILSRNLEKVLVPRFAVVKILKSRGLKKRGLTFSSFTLISEEKFLEKYVTPFQKDLPLLLDAYKATKSD
ncbi:unnamed protein product [Lathyrus oleraceus]|uniref:Uncharacterized protein n=1 Tax=Pisum sativum TaxID=3888 RepID=A0A9D5AIJ4_PEA|nr:transcription termination factor MTERF8, chloroplastic-like [Pisum sativum]KAI5409928.1 hypothetical protein KIW84_055400 [Pisum sativum]